MSAKTFWSRSRMLVPAMLLIGAAGCATGGSHSSSTIGKVDQAVFCDKCQTIWVDNSDQFDDYISYSRFTPDQIVVCPDCDYAIEAFFSTGKFGHNCSHCGGTLKHCTVHQGPVEKKR